MNTAMRRESSVSCVGFDGGLSGSYLSKALNGNVPLLRPPHSNGAYQHANQRRSRYERGRDSTSWWFENMPPMSPSLNIFITKSHAVSEKGVGLLVWIDQVWENIPGTTVENATFRTACFSSTVHNSFVLEFKYIEK